MGEIIDMHGKIAAAEGDKNHMLGKFLYYSLANLLVEKDALARLCEDLGIPYTGGKRLSVADAFRSATGDIQERIPVTRMGESHIYLAYCRDNKRTAEVLSRELVKETLNQQTNQYEKLANISYDKRDGSFRCDNLVMDDEKQRGKMTEEFYVAVKKEIAEYQERADYFIHSGCQSPAVLERWALKIQGLEARKQHYEQVLRRELDGLDDEFSTLKFLGQELQNRAKNIRSQKAA